MDKGIETGVKGIIILFFNISAKVLLIKAGDSETVIPALII
jgi:hypothetical protein